MKFKFLVFSFLTAALSSCQIYQSYFDCPPGPGVPCTSVTEIENMIVETKDGPDIFTGLENLEFECWRQRIAKCPKNKGKRVWIEDTKDPSRFNIGGHFIYLTEGDL